MVATDRVAAPSLTPVPAAAAAPVAPAQRFDSDAIEAALRIAPAFLAAEVAVWIAATVLHWNADTNPSAQNVHC